MGNVFNETVVLQLGGCISAREENIAYRSKKRVGYGGNQFIAMLVYFRRFKIRSASKLTVIKPVYAPVTFHPMILSSVPSYVAMLG